MVYAAGAPAAGRRVRAAIVAGAAAALICLVALMAASAAQAGTFDYCGNSGQTTFLTSDQPPSDRCTDTSSHQFIYTRTYVSGVNYGACAIVKEYNNGTGHNNTAPVCGPTSSYVQSSCSSPYSCNGYATITNNEATSGGYWGFASI